MDASLPLGRSVVRSGPGRGWPPPKPLPPSPIMILDWAILGDIIGAKAAARAGRMREEEAEHVFVQRADLGDRMFPVDSEKARCWRARGRQIEEFCLNGSTRSHHFLPRGLAARPPRARAYLRRDER